MKSKILLLRKKTDLLSGIVLVLVGLIFYWSATKISQPPVGVLVGSDFFPKAASLAMLLLGSLQLFLYLFNKYIRKDLTRSAEARGKDSPEATEPEAAEAATKITGPIVSCLLLFFYVVLLETIGFLILTPIYLTLQILVLAPKAKRRVVFFAVIALITSVILYVIFVYGLSVMLPSGIIG